MITDTDSHDDIPPPRMSRTITPLPIAAQRFMLELKEGSPVGDYEIQEQIGEGAMGTVYSAIHTLVGKTVAIKVLKPELCANQASIDRFVQEAQAVNRIGHPNIVDVFSLDMLPDGRAYMIMEWLHGEDLKIRLGRGPITVADACDILDGIARALDAAHAKDIVHRDLKPDNVFLHRVENGPVMVKLLDFGIAKLLRSQAKMEKTQTGNMLGTPRYISPEQARGVDVTHKSDIYSLGVLAYEMLAGRPPFQGETGMDLVIKHLSETPPPLSQFTRVPRPLEQCVMLMLSKDPAQRPTLSEIRQILGDPTKKVEHEAAERQEARARDGRPRPRRQRRVRELEAARPGRRTGAVAGHREDGRSTTRTRAGASTRDHESGTEARARAAARGRAGELTAADEHRRGERHGTEGLGDLHRRQRARHRAESEGRDRSGRSRHRSPRTGAYADGAARDDRGRAGRVRRDRRPDGTAAADRSTGQATAGDEASGTSAPRRRRPDEAQGRVEEEG